MQAVSDHRSGRAATTGAGSAVSVSEAVKPSARAWLTWGLGTSAYLVALFHRMSLGVAGGAAADRLHMTTEALGVFTFLQLSMYVLMQVPAGLAADRIGPRRTLVIGLSVMAVGEVAFALAHTLPLALAGRALVGIGDALTFVNVLRLAHGWFPERHQAMLAALTAAAGGLGQLCTTIPLQLSLTDLGWTTTFLASVTLTGVLAVVVWAAVRDRPPDAPAPTAAPASAGWTASTDAAPSAHLAKDHAPILATLRDAWRRTGTRHGFFVHMSLMAPFVLVTAIWGVPYMQHAQGLSHATAAAYLLICVAAFTAGLPLIGQAASRGVRVENRMVVGLATGVVVALATLALWPGVVVPRPVLIAALIAIGLGGSGSIAAFDIARREAPSAAAGSAMALVNCGGFLSAATGAWAVGLLLGAGASPDRYRTAVLGVLLLVAVVGTLQSARFARRRRIEAEGEGGDSLRSRRQGATGDSPARLDRVCPWTKHALAPKTPSRPPTRPSTASPPARSRSSRSSL
jgi:sugar phosphate permease